MLESNEFGSQNILKYIDDKVQCNGISNRTTLLCVKCDDITRNVHKIKIILLIRTNIEPFPLKSVKHENYHIYYRQIYCYIE